MNKYTYDFSITAPTQNDADSKMKSLSVLGSMLTMEELNKMAHILLHEPQKAAIAKKALVG